MKRTRAAVAVLLCNLLAGCAGVSAPVYDREPSADERPIGPHDLAHRRNYVLLNLQDGVTPRQDVERIMGLPDRVAGGGKVLVYHWMAHRYDSLDTTVDPAARRDSKPAEPRAIVWHFLLLEFNDAGLLQRHAMRTGDSEEGGPDTFDKALAGWLPPATTRP